MKNDSKRIKAFIFDMFGVLVVKKKNYYRDPLVEEVDGVLGDVINDAQFKIEAMENFDIDHVSFNRVFSQLTEKYEFDENIWRLLPKLKKKYKIAVLTNGSRFNSDMILKNVEEDEIFDEFISSSDLGYKKPDTEIFKIAAKRLGLDPSECIFIDDSLDNIKSAKEFGMKTIHWEDKPQCYEQIAQMLSSPKLQKKLKISFE